MNIRFMTCLMATMTLAVGASLSTASIIAQQDGGPNPFNGWTVVGDAFGTLNTGLGNVGVQVPGIGGHPQAVEITAPDPGGNAYVDYVVNTGELTGDYGTGGDFGVLGVLALSVQFYSYADNGYDPSDFRLFMLVNGHSWYYDVGPLVEGWGGVINVNMLHLTEGYGGWYSIGLTANDFHGDLNNFDVTQIGFELTYLSEGGQIYGFDNFYLYDTYFIPEPRTYLVLVVALASLAFVFREQVRQTLGTVLSSIRV